MDSIRFLIFFLFHKLRRLIGTSQQPQAIDLRFCAENKIDPKQIHPSHVFGLFGSFKQTPLAGQIDALVVPKRKRFGNALLQLADAFNIARQLGIRKIYHRGYSFLDDVAYVHDIAFVKGVPRASENYLIGDFFENQTLLNLCVDKLERWEIVHALTDYINLSLSAASDTSQDTNALYIHLRSGDIFKKIPPHREYGQPPLAFYQKIIRSQPWSKVYLVFENPLNPVIPALQKFLHESNIACETFSGDIHQDIEVLLRAKHLVIARGTFIYPILSLSKNIEQVFYFEIDEHSLWGLQNSPIKFHKCTDLGATYRATILTEWKNDAAQNALMLDYPEAHISIG